MCTETVQQCSRNYESLQLDIPIIMTYPLEYQHTDTDISLHYQMLFSVYNKADILDGIKGFIVCLLSKFCMLSAYTIHLYIIRHCMETT